MTHRCNGDTRAHELFINENIYSLLSLFLPPPYTIYTAEIKIKQNSDTFPIIPSGGKKNKIKICVPIVLANRIEISQNS